MKKLSLSLVFAMALLAPFASQADAATVSLVKSANSPAVYAVVNGSRYVFPNAAIYASWYPTGSSISTVSDATLASYPLAGSVTFKPGVSLVKLTTDPKVYAVGAGGVLHWIETEQVAAEIFGADWASQVHDLSDAFFPAYSIGQPVSTSGEFIPSNELTVAPDIASDLTAPAATPSAPAAPTGSIMVPPPMSSGMPTTSSTVNVLVTLGTSQAVLNQTVPVIVNVTGLSNVSRIEIYQDGQSVPVATCQGAMTCQYQYFVATSPLNLSFTAKVYVASGAYFEPDPSTLPVLQVAPTSSNLKISVSPFMVYVGARASFTSQVMNNMPITSHKVFASIPGVAEPVLWKDCGTATSCAASTPFYRTTTLFGQVVSGGQTFNSNEATVTVTGGNAPAPTLTATMTSPNLETITLSAPSGEMIGPTTIVSGTTPDATPLAMCSQSSCLIELQINVPGSVTAFTLVGGKPEASNTINVTPQPTGAAR